MTAVRKGLPSYLAGDDRERAYPHDRAKGLPRPPRRWRGLSGKALINPAALEDVKQAERPWREEIGRQLHGLIEGSA